MKIVECAEFQTSIFDIRTHFMSFDFCNMQICIDILLSIIHNISSLQRECMVERLITFRTPYIYESYDIIEHTDILCQVMALIKVATELEECSFDRWYGFLILALLSGMIAPAIAFVQIDCRKQIQNISRGVEDKCRISNAYICRQKQIIPVSCQLFS
jgi:hypothetical protein